MYESITLLSRNVENTNQTVALLSRGLDSIIHTTMEDLTPSVDCHSRPGGNYLILMAHLNWPNTNNLKNDVVKDFSECSSVAQIKDLSENYIFEWSKVWEKDKEEKVNEIKSYEPFGSYLLKMGISARDISSGKGLPDRNFFEVTIHTLRKKLGVRSEELRKDGTEPRFIFRLHGRSDFAVLLDDVAADFPIGRTHIKYCVEIKTVNSMSTDSGTNSSLREAVLQLVGLNVYNDRTSPSVVVTNLNKKHYVLFITKGDKPLIKLEYFLNIYRVKTLSLALAFANYLSSREPITIDFCRRPSPFNSPLSRKVDESEDIDDDMESVTLERIDEEVERIVDTITNLKM